jgi:hypothetical protein
MLPRSTEGRQRTLEVTARRSIDAHPDSANEIELTHRRACSSSFSGEVTMKTHRIAAFLGAIALGIMLLTGGAAAQSWVAGGNPGDLITSSTNQVGILTSVPVATLDVNGTVNVTGNSMFADITLNNLTVNQSATFNSSATFNQAATFNQGITVSQNGTFNQDIVVARNAFVNTDLNVGGNAVVGGTVTASGFIISSDARLKENIMPMRNVLAKLESIQPVYFTYNKVAPRPEGPQLGFIAQEVQKEFPAAVATMKDGYLGVAYANMAAVAIEGIREQQQTIRQLTAENAALSAQLKEESARIERLEAAMQQLTGCCPEPAGSNLK